MGWLREMRVAAICFAVLAAGCVGHDDAPAPSTLLDGNAASEDAAARVEAGLDAALEADSFAAEASAERDVAIEPVDASEEPSSDAPDGGEQADVLQERSDGAADVAFDEGPLEAAADASDAESEASDASADRVDDASDGADANGLVLTSIVITPPSPFLFPRTSIALAAQAAYYDPATGNTPVRDVTRLVTWSSSQPSGLWVSNTPGFQGRATGMSTGARVTVTATLGNVSGTADVSVGSPSLVEIGIAPTRRMIPLGIPFRLRATAVWSTGDKLDVTGQVVWSTSDPNMFSFDGNLVTAHEVGEADITAKVANLMDTLQVTSAAPILVAVTVTPRTPAIAQSTSIQLVATGLFADASSEDLTEFVTWSSSNDAVAKFADVNKFGVVTGVGAGSATLTATFDGNVAGTTTIGVTTATLMSLEVTSDRASYPLWVDHPTRAMAHFSDGSTQDVSAFASWSSSDQDVMAGRKLGSTLVTATFLGISGSTTITVVEAILDSIALNPSSPTILRGHDQPFHADATYLDANAQPFHLDLTAQAGWLSSNKTVARIDNLSRVSGLAMSLFFSGTTTISGAFAGVGGSTTLTVESQ